MDFVWVQIALGRFPQNIDCEDLCWCGHDPEQDPKTIIRVKSDDSETLAEWEASARAAKWESEKGNDNDDGSALVCAAVSRGSQQAQRTLSALESVLGTHVMKVVRGAMLAAASRRSACMLQDCAHGLFRQV